MTIVEKLIVQIFERHKSILEQVRKQTELFDQHLASKCVLDGISPPPWLLSLSLDSLSLHPSGLKKEELISGLLLPRSQAPSFYPSVHHPHSKRPFLPTSSKQEKPFDPAANEVQPNCLEREVHDFNTVNDSVGQFSVLSQFPATDTPGALNHARDSQDHDNCTDHSRSLVRIERSKSRQRALEIRSSARSAKLRANDENGDPGSCQNNVHSTKGEVKVAESWRKEGSSGHDNVRIQSGALCQLSSHMNELLSKKKSSDIVKKDLPRESTCMSMQQSNYADRMSEAANFTMAADEICATEEVNGGDCIINEGGSFIHSGGARSSRHSSLQNNALKAASDEVKSVNNGAKGGRFEHSSERSSKQATNDNRLQESAKPSATFSGSHERSNLKMTDNGSIEMGSNGDFVRVTRSTRSNRSQQGDECVQLSCPINNGKEDGCYSNRIPYHVDALRDSIKPRVEVPHLQSMEMRGGIMRIPKPTQSISPDFQNDYVYDLRKMCVSSNMAEDADIAVGEPNRLSQLLLSSRVIGKEVSYPEQEGTHPNGLTVRTTIFDSKKCGAVPADSGINSPGLVVADSLTSRSNSGAHSIGVTSRSESEDDMLMKPKQLDFDDMEVNRTSISDVQDDNGIMSSKQSPAERRSSCSSTEVTSVGHIEQNSLLPNTPCLSGFDSQEKPRKDSSQDLGKDTVNSASNMNSVQEQNSIAFAQNPYLCTSFMGSWPQYKRMKVGDRPSYPCSTTSNLTTVQFQPFPQYNKAISSDDHKHPGEEMLQDSDKNTVKAREVLSSKMQVKEDEHTMGGRDKSEYAALSFMHEHLEANPLSSLTKLSTGSSEGYFSGQAKVWEPTEMAGLQFSHESEVFSRQVSESFYLGRLVTESILQMTNSDAGGTHNPPVYPVAALVSVDSTAPDENGPELEKFVVETNDKEPSTAGPNFSDPYRHNPFVLDPPTISTSLFGNLAEDADANKQFESTSSNYLGDLSGFTSHEIYVFPTDSAPFIHGSSKVYSSPVRKFWEPMPLKSLSSERQASSIPDLPSINEEETENMDDDIVITSPENAIKIVERKPLVDIMESANPPASICNEDDVIDDRYSIASVCTEFSVAGSVCKLETGNRRISRSRYGYATSNKGKSKQRQQQLRVPLGVKRSNGSLQNSLFSKPPKLLRKNEPRKFSAGLLEKAPKHNNIVSNVTSFVPLVQQQKRMAAAAAAAVTGKRDIKVKSLEAAEAAKRLAEKKENDKRLKKEALKLERRARIEEQNLRQLELEKERKEEQKKEAEMAAKKRQREEEQKKERERKRKRIEDKRKQNMEQRDKMNYGDKEETKCGREAPDVKASKLMENVEEERMVKATGTTNPIGSAAYDTRNMNSVDNSKDVMENQICEGKENNYSLESDIVPARSYEISPYKGSDDEDEEAEDDDDDDKPNTKFIPSWSRRRGITFTILSQQAKLDPATVFPLESFISKDQVILPRKLRHL
ncbi:unnamed protein product [Linum tenue]|uniref:Inner centromere protein ARK-binding domain-containing protein n=1 Tax=Linum tenue TaxID=586396 RepID=A0AAV0LGK5_9ROSI|nr:unnamed protein product [Linum tenue]